MTSVGGVMHTHPNEGEDPMNVAVAIKATPVDTEINIIGSGALSYQWWGRTTANYTATYDPNYTVPDGWELVVMADDPNGDEGTWTLPVTINHAKIVEAVEKIVGGEVKVNTECEAECMHLLFQPDDVDFDATTADVVLQIVAFGEVVYG
jgi:hypothetical protein